MLNEVVGLRKVWTFAIGIHALVSNTKKVPFPRVIRLSCHTRVCTFRLPCRASNWSEFAMVYGKMSMFEVSKRYFISIKMNEKYLYILNSPST